MLLLIYEHFKYGCCIDRQYQRWKIRSDRVPTVTRLKSGEIVGNITVLYSHKYRRHSNAEDGWTNSKGNRWILLMFWLSWWAMRLLFFLSLGSSSEPRPPPCWGFEIALRHTAFGRTPLCEWSDRRSCLYLTKKYTTLRRKRYPRLRRDFNPPSQQKSGRRPKP
jgi:hypothetical protein